MAKTRTSKIKEETTRGLSSLMGQIKKEQYTLHATVQERAQFLEVDTKYITTNPKNPRQIFDESALDELVKSIEIHGLIQPITAIRISAKKYQIISGERRWKASIKAGLKKIPAYIRTANDQEIVEWAIIENLQRESLNPIELAIGFRRMMEELNYTQEQVAQRVSKDRSTITNALRLLKLPPEIQINLKNGVISSGHARAIIALDNIDAQLEILRQIKINALSVRKTEQLVKNYDKKNMGLKPIISPNIHITKLEKELSIQLQQKVTIKHGKENKGQIKISYSSTKELNQLVDKLRV